jgi:hypothetical protein
LWTYNSSNGNMTRNGQLVATGYSGHGDGVNNPTLESEPDIGPIPCGLWIMSLPAVGDHPQLGPTVIQLTPANGTVTFGRGGFFIHGDEIGHAGEDIASHGCIIMPAVVRETISGSGDTDLEVV